VEKHVDPSVADLSARAAAALPRSGLGLQLTPALPVAWPPQSPDIEWFAYERTPLPTGVVAYQVSGPSYRVSVTLPDGKPEVTAVPDGKELGRENDRRSGAPKLEAAEQALVDVVLGHRAADSARNELAPYAHWAAASSTIGADLRRRKPAFFHWLDAATP